MTLFKKLLLSVSFIVFIHDTYASDFEGRITFIKETLYDTTIFTFTVKENLVRIDERNSKQQILQSLIVDIETKKITALSPSLKLYTTIKKHSHREKEKQQDFICLKTTNFKYINGYKCYQWRMRNQGLNCEISYWVSGGNLNVINEVFQLLSGTDDYAKYCLYFDQIPQSNGYFPVMIVERTLLRDKKFQFFIQDINTKKIDDQLFNIPKGYKYLRS
jgi:hypothetical protein